MGGTCAVREEPGKQKPRSLPAAGGLPGAGIWPEPCPRKCAAEKSQSAELNENWNNEQTGGNDQRRDTSYEMEEEDAFSFAHEESRLSANAFEYEDFR